MTCGLEIKIDENSEHTDMEYALQANTSGCSSTKSVFSISFSRVSGASPPKPVSSFGHFGFDDALIKAIRRSEFAQPTPIQSQAIPALSSGRDCIGIAKTGSGKTAAFLWPMLGMSSLTCRHIK